MCALPADDILVFAASFAQAQLVLNSLVACLETVGLVPNTDQTAIMTTEAQPSEFLPTVRGKHAEVLPNQIKLPTHGCVA